MRFFNLKKAYWQQKNELPPGYRRVEYIESTGEQWIDTECAVTSAMDMEFVFAFTDLSTGQLMGGYNAKPRYNIGLESNMFRFALGSGWTTISSSPDTNKHTWILSADRLSGSIDGKEVSSSYTDFSVPAGRVFLFCRATNRNPSVATHENFYMRGKAFAFALRDDNIHVRNLVPCIRISDSKPGLYDLCGSICSLTGTSFYVNAGSGSDFTWGELQ